MSRKLRFPKDWIERKQQKEKISVLTCYDATSAVLVERAGVDAILVGDTMGMVLQGHSSTMPVKLDHIIYHGQCVRRGAPGTFLIVDMPFGTYHASVEQGVNNAMRLIQETEAQAVKLEGADEDTLKIIRKIVAGGAPVMGHIGFTPQSYLSLGGFRIQGKSNDAADALIEQAKALQSAGCFSIVLELMPTDVSRRISEAVQIPTIGIGAGIHCDGQVQVFQDLLGLLPDFAPKHARKYDQAAERWITAIGQYDNDVKSGSFPGPENSH
ncbi:3-methyl-2-oxobutanoate hydroxymethyltransferase [Leptonema illini]|uniref:3-methyl-2-oxobutanoate hydroxymethyltransferase n=1 Tax=Leptonema illini DSM 21528 TaxID=929563 RepID=H2CKW4_9LEPT|nr:3-methyl-2-oxobutanoate hydroxymethyltransferase [Leptonema illini]EHQ06198.1 ketopantoate hydroxymethyltransferase [Leptonema illini DSM 21528]